MFAAFKFLSQDERASRIRFYEHADRLTLDELAALRALKTAPVFNLSAAPDAELIEALDYFGHETTHLSDCTRSLARASLKACRDFRAARIGAMDCAAQRRSARTYLESLARSRRRLAEVEAEIDRRRSFAAQAA